MDCYFSLALMSLCCLTVSAVEICGRGLPSINQASGGQYSSPQTGYSYVDCSATGAIRNRGTLTRFEFYTYDTQTLVLQLWRTTAPPMFRLIYELSYTPRASGNQTVTVNWAVESNDRGGFYYPNTQSVPIPYKVEASYYSFQHLGQQARTTNGSLEFGREPAAKQFLFNFCEDDASVATPPPATTPPPTPPPATLPPPTPPPVTTQPPPQTQPTPAGQTGCFGYKNLDNPAAVFNTAEQGPLAFVDNEATAPNEINGNVAYFQFYSSGTGTIRLQIYRIVRPPSQMSLIGQKIYVVNDPTPQLHRVAANIQTERGDRVGFTVESGGPLLMRKVLQADAYCSIQRDLSKLNSSPSEFNACNPATAMRFPIQACTGTVSPTPPTQPPVSPTTATPAMTPPSTTNRPQSTPSTPPPPPGPTTTQLPSNADNLMDEEQERAYIIVGVSVGAYILLIILISIGVCVGVKSNDSKAGTDSGKDFDRPSILESPKLRENPLYSEPRRLHSEPDGYSSVIQPEPPAPPVEYHTESLNRSDSYQATRDSFKVRESVHSNSFQGDVSYTGSINQPTNMVIEDNPTNGVGDSFQDSLYARGSTRPVSPKIPTSLPAEDQDDSALHSYNQEPLRQVSVKEIRERFATLEKQHDGHDSQHKEAVLAEMRTRFSRY